MYRENKMNSRGAFLKKVSLAVVSVVGIGFAGFSFQKRKVNLGFNVKTLSDDEAKEMARNLPSSELNRLKPEPPPKMQHPSED